MDIDSLSTWQKISIKRLLQFKELSDEKIASVVNEESKTTEREVLIEDVATIRGKGLDD